MLAERTGHVARVAGNIVCVSLCAYFGWGHGDELSPVYLVGPFHIQGGMARLGADREWARRRPGADQLPQRNQPQLWRHRAQGSSK